MALERGDRIIATQKVETGAFFGGAVEKGTAGVITAVNEAFFGGTSYEVTFEDGTKATVKAEHVAKT